MTLQTKSAILLYNGDFFDFKDPYNHEYDIETIAHALSNLCRYTGHTKLFYSVAEHCVLVSYLTPEPFALEGLMHDASEAYCGDVASPLKKLLSEYNDIEEGVQKALFKYFNLRYPMPACVHEADKIAYVTERQSISNTGKDELWFTDLVPEKIKVIGHSPEKARKLFMDRFEVLNNARNEVVRAETKTRAAAA
jgi:5'-deoxynucleotidase YfbR-like HD superfamily hydrolase